MNMTNAKETTRRVYAEHDHESEHGHCDFNFRAAFCWKVRTNSREQALPAKKGLGKSQRLPL